MKKLLAIVASLGFACAFAVQGNTPPRISVKLPSSGKAGQTVKATVLLTFAEGLHAYQNPPSTPDLLAIVVTLDTKDAKLKSVTYPAGKDEVVAGSDKPVRVYEGAIKIPVTVVLPKKHGKLQLAFRVSFQQCNQQSCFPPDNVSARAPIAVK